MDELMDMPRGQEKKEDRMEAMDRRDHDLREVLSPEQFRMLKQHEEEMKERRRDNRMGGQDGRY
jgi:Spy/CpxP family protein refolding chaperone